VTEQFQGDCRTPTGEAVPDRRKLVSAGCLESCRGQRAGLTAKIRQWRETIQIPRISVDGTDGLSISSMPREGRTVLR
jgi:hypothetical protein